MLVRCAGHPQRSRRQRRVVYEGDTVVVGDTAKADAQPLFGDSVRYELLCRNHFRTGDLGE